jgi:4-hydroxy-tetrahydrodipicolinate synthase
MPTKLTAGAVLGIVPVIPTPFAPGGDVEDEALGVLVDFAVSAGAKAVCLPAYGSEFYKLTGEERSHVVEVAVRKAAGRIRIMAQSNHASSHHAAEIARKNEALGAEIISVALPRQFALPEEALLRFSEEVAHAVQVPVLIQDFNPGGPSVGAAFARRLMEAAPNFRYLKLEEPLMGSKVRSIRESTKDSIGVLEGWGGMYIIELVPDGICGAMPGLPMCDLFVKVFEMARAGELDAAMEIHRSMLPQIVYGLQNMELFHHCEKRLLAARGLLKSVDVREPSLTPDEGMSRHIEVLNRLVLSELARQGFT